MKRWRRTSSALIIVLGFTDVKQFEPGFGCAPSVVNTGLQGISCRGVYGVVWKVLAVVLLVAVGVGLVVERAVTNIQVRTIADVRSSNTRGGTVVLQGTIVFADENRFVLDDGTGKVELSTCPVWYKRIDLYKGDRARVMGQVMGNPSFSTQSDFVVSVHKVFHGGRVIRVRTWPGKPPWTSYRAPDVSNRSPYRL